MATIKSELDYIQEARSQLAEALITKFGVRRYDNAKDNPTLKGLWTVKADGSADKLKRLHDWALLVTGTNVHTDASLTFKSDGKGDAAGTTFNGSVARSISYNSIGAAPAVTGGYLPLSGGTMTGLIKGNNKGGSWIVGRTNAAMYLSRNTTNDWHPVIGFKTKTGSWEFGSVGDNDLATFSWGSDSNYSSGTNNTTIVNLRNTSGTIALTSEIPTKASWNYDDVYSKLGHTHTTTIATSTDTNQIALVYGGKYKLTAGGTSYVFTMPTSDNTWRPIGTGATDAAAGNHTHDGRYLRWNGSAADVTAMGWGTLTSANGYTILSHASSSDGGDMGFTNKGGKIFMLLDGHYYQNEGKYRVLDTSDFTTFSNIGNQTTRITIGGVTKDLKIDADTLDGYHQGNAIHYKWKNTYTQPTPGEVWHLKIKAADWTTTSDWIWVRCEGNNAYDDYVINTGSRRSAWWAYGVRYTNALINGCTKIISNSCDTYIRLTEQCTRVFLYTTFIPASVTNDSASSYTTLVPGLNASNFYGNATTADKWKTSRTLTIGNTGKSVDGSANVSWSLAEIGASASAHTHSVKINGATKTIAASGGTAVDLGNYLPLSGGTMSGSIILKGSTSPDMTYGGNIHPYIRFDNANSNQNVSLIFTDYDSYRSPAGIKLIGNQGSEWFEAPNIYAANFYGTLSGNASSATKLTSSAGSAALPIYFSDGKPVTCTSASLFSNLSNSGNDLSITIAGQNRTLTVNYANSSDKSNYLTSRYIGNDGDTVAQVKLKILDSYTSLSDKQGYTIKVNYLFMEKYSEDNYVIPANGLYFLTYLTPGYNGKTYGQWLATHAGSSRLYVFGRYDNLWTERKTIAWTSDIPTVTNYYWANVKVSSSSSTSTLPTFNTCYTSNWFRSTGATGWYSETYGGGWRMTDTTYIRVYGSKRVYNDNTSQYAFYTSGGMTALGHIWSSSSAQSWLNGQKAETAALNIAASSDTGSYWPWFRQTLTAAKKWISVGTLSTSLYFIGSTTSRTANSYDYGFVMNFSNGTFTSSGSVYATHFYENSDIRYKKILNNLLINSNTIANLPLFDFEWIENNTIGTGTSAQAVQVILPNIVSGTDKLTLDYGVLGTIAGITACKELVTLKSEIDLLKKRIKKLELKLKIINDYGRC